MAKPLKYQYNFYLTTLCHIPYDRNLGRLSCKKRSALFFNIMQHLVVIPYRHFGTIYQSHLLDHSR